MSISTYLEDALLNHVFRYNVGGASYTRPSTTYVAFHTADPTDAGTGAEMTGGSYSRRAMTFGAPSSGSILNTNTIAWADLPTGTVTHIAIWNASTGGNLLVYKEITPSIVFNSGDGATINPGGITITLE